MAKELQGVIRQSPYFNERLWMSRQLNGGKFSVSPSVTLETILDWLSKDATDMAKAPPVVSQAKGKNATRNHFIREMYAMHKHIYGKPLWDMLAASANVMFNLSAKDSLSADDIRPLIQ
jgi:hypothetical protein